MFLQWYTLLKTKVVIYTKRLHNHVPREYLHLEYNGSQDSLLYTITICIQSASNPKTESH